MAAASFSMTLIAYLDCESERDVGVFKSKSSQEFSRAYQCLGDSMSTYCALEIAAL